MYHRVRESVAPPGGKQIFAMDFQNDGEFVGGCIAGSRNYFHINANGDVEPCVFIHYSSANIRDVTLLEALKQPLFAAYRDNQPFNGNHLRPCPMLENPASAEDGGGDWSQVHRPAVPESVEHLCGKCKNYAKNEEGPAAELWDSRA